MNVQLTPQELRVIFDYIVIPLNKLNSEVYLFGSRATNKAKKYSDVDILVKPLSPDKNIQRQVSEIEEKIENSNFPYKVDIVLETNLANSYREEVNKTKILLTYPFVKNK